MSDTTIQVICEIHGKSHATFICQHLLHGYDLGFYHGENKNDPRPDAWCADCDRFLLENGGVWNDVTENFAGVTLLCAGCYDIVRERNEVPFKRTPHPGQTWKRIAGNLIIGGDCHVILRHS
ncbi:MAG: hypothetical protein JXA42_04935 [Anaerolineales bacterium]|nr:hypothetical protein [Anaerolineales bacterium]